MVFGHDDRNPYEFIWFSRLNKFSSYGIWGRCLTVAPSASLTCADQRVVTDHICFLALGLQFSEYGQGLRSPQTRV